MTDTAVMGINFTMQKIRRMMVGVIGVLRQRIEVFGNGGGLPEQKWDGIEVLGPLHCH
jgi:hypothetical protein